MSFWKHAPEDIGVRLIKFAKILFVSTALSFKVTFLHDQFDSGKNNVKVFVSKLRKSNIYENPTYLEFLVTSVICVTKRIQNCN